MELFDECKGQVDKQLEKEHLSGGKDKSIFAERWR